MSNSFFFEFILQRKLPFIRVYTRVICRTFWHIAPTEIEICVSVAKWSELGIWIRKTPDQIPDSDYWIDLCSVILGANAPRFLNSQLVCLLPVGILNWERGERDFNLILKSSFRGVIIKNLLLLLLLLLLISRLSSLKCGFLMYNRRTVLWRFPSVFCFIFWNEFKPLPDSLNTEFLGFNNKMAMFT